MVTCNLENHASLGADYAVSEPGQLCGIDVLHQGVLHHHGEHVGEGGVAGVAVGQRTPQLDVDMGLGQQEFGVLLEPQLAFGVLKQEC